MFFKGKDFIPYGKHNLNRSDIREVLAVLKGQFLTQGPKVNQFEENICKAVGAKYGVSANSATSALHIACLALGLEKNDILWTSSITFVASANAALYCGAKIDFIDIDIKTGLISIDSLKQKLIEANKKGTLPKIIMPVHLSGTSCEMKEIYNLSKKYGFKIIEDASHAIGGAYKESLVGSCKYSDVTIFSFHPVKIITSGEGGIATTNSESLQRLMRLFANHGITKNRAEFIGSKYDDWMYEQQVLGHNYRITDIQCALGISQLKRLKKIVNMRNQKLLNYKKLLIDLPLSLLEIPNDIKSSVHLAIVRFHNLNADEHSKAFHNMRQRKIGVQLHYYPVHLQPFFRNMGFSKGYLPNSEKFAESVFSIPLFPEISNSQQKRVVKELELTLKSLKKI